MERKAKVLFSFAFALMFLSGFVACYAVYPVLFAPRHGVAVPKANVVILWEHAGGTDVLYSGNVITDIGLQHLRDMAANGGTFNAIKYISIGNATASSSLTDLTSEFDRQAGNVVTWMNGGYPAFNVTYKWVNVGPCTLNAVGLHWDASASNTLFAVANFVQTTFGANDNCTIKWVITFQPGS